MSVRAQEMLAEYLESQARYWDDPQRPRPAEQLREIASWVRNLPDDHPDIRALQTLQRRPGGWGLDVFVPDEEASWLSSRVGFGPHQSRADFLHALVGAVVVDEMEDDIEKLDDE